VITCAALIMTSVFLAFLLSTSIVIKMLALGLAVSIVIDASIIRLLVVPAAMFLFGKYNWWTPRWLSQLPPAVTRPVPATRSVRASNAEHARGRQGPARGLGDAHQSGTSVRLRTAPTAAAAAAVIILTLAACSNPAGPAHSRVVGAAATKAGPDGDAFYQPPGVLPAGAHGTLIWARPSQGPAVLSGATNTLLLYTQQGINGTTVATSGSVAVPRGTPPHGGWPVVTWGHGTTGIADQCAPTRYNNPKNAATNDPLLQAWVSQGYAVVASDYEGLGPRFRIAGRVASAIGRGRSPTGGGGRVVRVGHRGCRCGFHEGRRAAPRGPFQVPGAGVHPELNSLRKLWQARWNPYSWSALVFPRSRSRSPVWATSNCPNTGSTIAFRRA